MESESERPRSAASTAVPPPEALDQLERVIAKEPNNPTAWVAKGILLDKLARSSEAIEAYDRALALEPENFDAWYDKGIALSNLGRWGEVVACYEKATTIDGRNLFAMENLCEALLVRGEAQRAHKVADQALGLASGTEDKIICWYLWITAILLAGETDKAREEIELFTAFLNGLEVRFNRIDWDFDLLTPVIAERAPFDEGRMLLELTARLNEGA